MSGVGLTTEFDRAGLHHYHDDDVYREGVGPCLLYGRGVFRAGRGRCFSFFYRCFRPEIIDDQYLDVPLDVIDTILS